ncbi:MAG TPA: DUF6337 family protein [Gemmatimonadaceae bacterium]|nr:DUF6337 family protein [Gemmatimonadaceae bacterium]
MIYATFLLLVTFTLMFSRHEEKLWGSRRTPFAFVVYPFLALLFITIFVGPGMGFYSLHVETLLVFGLSFALFAIASVSLARVGATAQRAPRPETTGAGLPAATTERRVGSLEYAALGAVLVLAFGATIANRGGGDVVKGELGIGGIGGHLIEAGIAYLVIAGSDLRAKRAVRLTLAFLVLWLLAINQVKALIFLPLSAAVLYRWASGQMATWTVALIVFGVPLGMVVAVYAYFGASAAVAGFVLTPELVMELARHLVAYLMAGILGLDQLMVQVKIVALGPDGLEFALAPFTNIIRFVIGTGDYFTVVNSLYVIIHPGEMIDSNVFTLFGSLLYRGGWVGLIAITLAYGLVSYWIWSRWRMRDGALASAAGSWWLAPLLFAWFDPYFTTFTFMEVMIFLALRGSVTLPRLSGRAPRAAVGNVSTPGY